MKHEKTNTSRFQLFRRDRRGAIAVEFAFMFPVVVVFCMGFIEFGLIIFDYHRLSEATRRGSRMAVIQESVMDIDTLPAAGTLSCQGTATCVEVAPFAAVLTAMQGIQGDIVESQVKIIYTDTGITGDAATPSVVTPMVTVEIVGFQHQYFFLNYFNDILAVMAGGAGGGMGASFTFPNFSTTRIKHSVNEA